MIVGRLVSGVCSSVAWRVIWIGGACVSGLQLYMHEAGANHTMASRMNVPMSAGLSTGLTDQYNLMLFERGRQRNTEKTRANRERKRDPSAFTDCDEDKQAENKETDRKTGRISG